MDGLDDRIETLREDRAQRDPRLVGDRPHGIDPPQRDLERLFADHVDALPGGGLQPLEMGAGRGGNRDEIRLLALDHRGGVGIPAAAELLSEGHPLRLGAAAPGDEFDALEVPQRPGVHPRDRADADDRGPHPVPPRGEAGRGEHPSGPLVPAGAVWPPGAGGTSLLPPGIADHPAIGPVTDSDYLVW